MTYTIYYTNFGRVDDNLFNSTKTAIEAGKKNCFEFTVHEVESGNLGSALYIWSPISGLHSIMENKRKWQNPTSNSFDQKPTTFGT